MVLIGVAVFGLWPFCFEGFNLKSSVFLARAWCLGFQAFRILGFLGSLGVGGLVLHRRLPVVRPKASRPKAEVPEGRHVRGRTSPKGDAPGGQTPRRETRPEADNSKVDTHSLAVVPGPKKSARTGAGALRLRAKSPRPGAGALPPTDRRWILARLSSFGTDI